MTDKWYGQLAPPRAPYTPPCGCGRPGGCQGGHEDGQNGLCDGPKGYHDRACWLDKKVCAFVLACTCSPRNTRPCPSHGERS